MHTTTRIDPAVVAVWALVVLALAAFWGGLASLVLR